MSKTRKILNYILAITGLGLLVMAIFKSDITISLLGLIVIDNSLSALSLDKNEEKIKSLEKEVEILKGNLK